jgi:hypothetical protein
MSITQTRPAAGGVVQQAPFPLSPAQREELQRFTALRNMVDAHGDLIGAAAIDQVQMQEIISHVRRGADQLMTIAAAHVQIANGAHLEMVKQLVSDIVQEKLAQVQWQIDQLCQRVDAHKQLLDELARDIGQFAATADCNLPVAIRDLEDRIKCLEAAETKPISRVAPQKK